MRVRWVVRSAVLMGFLAFFFWDTKFPDGKLHVSILDVGQGSASFIESPTGTKILVDGGPDLSLLAKLTGTLSFWNRRIDLLVLTSPKGELLGSLPEILRRFSVGAVLMPSSPSTTAQHRWFLSEIRNRSIPVFSPHVPQTIDLGGGSWLQIFPAGSSLVLRLVRGSGAVLFAGSPDAASEKKLVVSGINLKASVLFVPRHGSRTGTSDGMLRAVSPKTAVISVGKGAPYGYPHAGTLERIASHGVTLKRTDTDGSLHFSFP